MGDNEVSVIKVSSALHSALQRARLLRRVRTNQVHQWWGQTIIRLQPEVPQPAPDLVHTIGVITLLDDRTHERSELRLLPSLTITQLRMHKVKTLESMVLLNAPVHVSATVLAGDASNSGIRVDW